MRVRSRDLHHVTDLRIERLLTHARTDVDLEHALIHADVAHLRHGAIFVGELDLARKQADEAISITKGHRADLHAARAAIVHPVAHAFAHRNLHNVRDAREHAHGWTQRDDAMRVVRWLVAVERDAQARHIEMRFWEAIDGRRVVAVNDARVDARSLERAHALDETVDLDLEIERFGGIGSCEMREAVAWAW